MSSSSWVVGLAGESPWVAPEEFVFGPGLGPDPLGRTRLVEGLESRPVGGERVL